MPRGGAGAAGAEEVRADMVKGSGAGKGGMFDSIVLKRMQPWKLDGSQMTDVFAGQVDANGKFKGMCLKSVHIQALLRFFKLSATCLPQSIPPQVADLAGAMQDGFPIVIVTQGVWGRAMENAVGPSATLNRETVWTEARAARAENPRLLLTCVDVPAGLDGDVIEACLSPPLCDYRELMFQNGSWYTPEVVSAANVAAQWKELLPKPWSPKTKTGVNFQRKKFAWRADDTLNQLYTVIWKPVLEVYPAKPVPARSDLSFIGASPKAASVKDVRSYTEILLKKALSSSEGDDQATVTAVEKFLASATAGDDEGLKEAARASMTASKASDKSLGIKAAKSAAAAYSLLKDYGESEKAASLMLKLSTELKDAKGEMEAVALKMSVLDAKGDTAAKLQVALSESKAFAASGNKANESAALSLAVTALIEEDQYEEALKQATTSQTNFKTSGSKAQEACAWLDVATANMMLEKLDDALSARKTAQDLYKAAGEKKDALEAAKLVVESLFAKADNAGALAAAKAMLEDAQQAGERKCEGAALQLVATAIRASGSPSADEAAEMVEKAKTAMTIFEELKDKEALASAQDFYANTLWESKGFEAANEVLVNAQSAAARYNELGGGAGLTSALLCSAKAALAKGNTYTAAWDAKQAVRNAFVYGDDGAMQEAMGVHASATSSGDIQVGPLVPVAMGGQVVYI